MHTLTNLAAAITLAMIISAPCQLADAQTQQTDKTTSGWRILFAPVASTITYLIDQTGNMNHTWDNTYRPAYSCYSLQDGIILRTTSTGKYGGGVQKITWDGTVIWDYQYHDMPSYSATHEAIMLPNGDVLMLATEYKSYDDAVQAGRDPSLYINPGDHVLDSDYIIEVHPTGPTSGIIVWEWHIWDHLIQDYDVTKSNYGVVSQHPELMNINYIGDPEELDALGWLHSNSLDYNASRDQILLSLRNPSEIYVIDHSTTIQEAAGHTGGTYGHGGDFIYRWGNPAAYDQSGSRMLHYQHSVKWVPSGYPGVGHITIFDNCAGATYSKALEIIPPLNPDGTYYKTGGIYGPTSYLWTYTVTPRSFHMGSVQRMPNGNTLICGGENGRIWIVKPTGETAWSYTYDASPGLNWIFNACLWCDQQPSMTPDLETEGSLVWSQVTPGSIVSGSFTVRNIGTGVLDWSVDVSNLTWGDWTFTPQTGSTGSSMLVQVSVIVPDEQNGDFEGYIRVYNANNASDYDLVPVILTTILINPEPKDGPLFGINQLSITFCEDL